MATIISNSPEETLALGAEWGREARPGLVIGLTGGLGAGKTTLVQGIARGLGITARVTSPSFTLVNIHEQGRLLLCHLDLYRLETPEQVITAGLQQYLDHPEGVTVVEWIERWDPSKPGAGTAQIQPTSPSAGSTTDRGAPVGQASCLSPISSGGASVPASRAVVVGRASSLSPLAPRDGSAAAPGVRYRRVVIETVSATARRISYEDTGA